MKPRGRADHPSQTEWSAIQSSVCSRSRVLRPTCSLTGVGRCDDRYGTLLMLGILAPRWPGMQLPAAPFSATLPTFFSLLRPSRIGVTSCQPYRPSAASNQPGVGGPSPLNVQSAAHARFFGNGHHGFSRLCPRAVGGEVSGVRETGGVSFQLAVPRSTASWKLTSRRYSATVLIARSQPSSPCTKIEELTQRAGT
jgi:hypothetical protein